MVLHDLCDLVDMNIDIDLLGPKQPGKCYLERSILSILTARWC